MNTVVAVVVYDRFSNILEWVRCWNMCETQGAQLVIVHNFENEHAKVAYSEFCRESDITYVPRVNVGYDIGALQDVCYGCLPGFPEFDFLIWCTDDTIPMHKDFIRQMVDPCRDITVGCVAMEISKEVTLHIRTTGFCISRETANKITFQADPIKTKEDCYAFEHRGGNIFLRQITNMGLKAIQVSDIAKSPFWDTGHKRTKSRKDEHYLLFPKPEKSKKKVLVICPVYNVYPEIISSMINQTHDNWEMHLVHDGKSQLDIKGIVEATGDDRIKYTETPERAGNWGHSIRRDYLEKLKDVEGDYILITNGDNFYAPVFFEYMLKGFVGNTIAVYCSQMIHSYLGWGVINCKLQQGFLDCGGVMVRKDVACRVGWKDVMSHSSDWIYFKSIIDAHGSGRFKEVKGCLFSHN